MKEVHDIKGAIGWADRITDKRFDTHPTAIASWLLWNVQAHPMFNHYAAHLIHLRDVEDIKPANKEKPNYTHEIMVFALDPDVKPSKTDFETIHHLHPPNHVCQFECGSDSRAIETLKHAVEQLCLGNIWIDPNDIGIARQQFKNSVREFASQ